MIVDVKDKEFDTTYSKPIVCEDDEQAITLLIEEIHRLIQ
jgi:hypothetical protein